MNIGVAQLSLKTYHEALECLLTALKIAEKLDNIEIKGNVMGNLGRFYNLIMSVYGICILIFRLKLFYGIFTVTN